MDFVRSYFLQNPYFSSLRSQIEGYNHLLIFRNFSILPSVIWASPFTKIQENFLPFCFFTYTSEIFSILPLLLEPTLLLEPPLVLEN